MYSSSETNWDWSCVLFKLEGFSFNADREEVNYLSDFLCDLASAETVVSYCQVKFHCLVDYN